MLSYLETFANSIQRSGRLVATNFLTLPSKRELPDYYKVIKMPIALDTIEEKLKRQEFPESHKSRELLQTNDIKC